MSYREFRNSRRDTPKNRLVRALVFMTRDAAEASRARAANSGYRAKIYTRTVKADRVEIDVFAVVAREK